MRSSPAVLAVTLMLGLAPASRAAEIIAPSSLPLAQSVVTLAANSDAVLGSSAGRRYLCLQNIGAGLITLGFGQAAIAGAGWALEAPAAAGHQGGAMCWEASALVANDVHAISAAGSTVVVLEGH